MLQRESSRRQKILKGHRFSVVYHCKDSRDMVDWLNKTAEVLLSAGCSLSSCDEADTSMLYNNLHNWSSNLEEGDLGCIEKFYGVHV